MNQRHVARAGPGLLLALLFALWSPLPAEAAAVATRSQQVAAREPVGALELTGEDGEVRVVAGARFAATITIKVEAETQAAADFLLARTSVRFSERDGARDARKVVLGTSPPSRDERAGNGKHTIDVGYQITLPAAARLEASTVNGNIFVEGVSGPQRLGTINGRLAVIGAAGSLLLKSVNGNVEGTLAEVSKGAEIAAETVNGWVTLWVPANARLRLQASSVSGELVSTLPLPVRKQAANLGSNRHYEGATEPPGPLLRMKSVNGRVALLAAGTSVATARPLVISAAPQKAPPASPAGETGDFVVEGGAAEVRTDAIAGAARVRTQAGDVRLGSVGKSAQIETTGGDIRVGVAKSDLHARTGGGDIEIGEIGGNARLDSLGGSIDVRGCAGDLQATTAGGDVRLQRVQGGVRAQTAGGTVTVEIVGKARAAGVEIGSNGGDVTLTLPANYRADVVLESRMGDGVTPRTSTQPLSQPIRSEFAELAPSLLDGVHSARGKLGGGGPKVIVRTIGGLIKLVKGPAL